MRDITAAARLSLATLALLTVAACSAPAPEPQDEDEAASRGRATDETVFDDMIETQDKARAVEGVTLGRKGDLDAALGQAEDESASTEE